MPRTCLNRIRFYYYLYPGNDIRDFFMLSQNQLKHISALKIKKFRDEYREFIAEGNTLVLDLIQSSFEIASVYAMAPWIAENLSRIMEKKIPLFETDALDMSRITSLSTPSQVLALVKIPEEGSEDLTGADPNG